MCPRLSSTWPSGLACPVCRHPLPDQAGAGVIECTACTRRWPQHGAFPELLPDWLVAADWPARQAETTRYYRALLDDPVAATKAFAADFESLRASLASLRGRLLDVGGGNGLVRDYLPAVTEYVSLDPDPAWVDPAWDTLAPWTPCLRSPFQFVRGLAEYLPFADASFDSVAAVFSLNHCLSPQKALRQMLRVSRPGGTLLLVLEDVEPGWRDALLGTYRDWRGWSRAKLASEKVRAVWRGSPIEKDHVPIAEREVCAWLGDDGRIISRAWRGSYLVLALRSARPRH
jgi:SAM-dependent methyltransferase